MLIPGAGQQGEELARSGRGAGGQSEGAGGQGNGKEQVGRVRSPWGGEEEGRAGGGQGWLTSLIHISVSSRLLAGCLAAGLLIRPINFLGPEM